MAKEYPFQILGVTGILSESLKIPRRNPKLMFHVTLFSLLPILLLSLAYQLTVLPLKTDMTSKANLLPTIDPTSPEFTATLAGMQKDLRSFYGLESIFLPVLFIVSGFAFMAMVYSSAVIFAGKHLTLKELCCKILKFKTWKRPLLTWFYVLLITIGYIFLVTLVFVVFTFILTNTVALISMFVLFGLVAAIVYYYLVVVWMLGLVISVVEEDCYGHEAHAKANELIKGRKLQGCILMLVLMVISGCILMLVLMVISAVIFGFFRGSLVHDRMVILSGVGTICSVVICLLKLFVYVVFTVFYFECKKSHGEKVELGDGVGYSLAFAAPHVDTALP